MEAEEILARLKELDSKAMEMDESEYIEERVELCAAYAEVRFRAFIKELADTLKEEDYLLLEWIIALAEKWIEQAN